MKQTKKFLLVLCALATTQISFADRYIPLAKGAKINCPKGTLTAKSTLADVEKACVIEAEDRDNDVFDNEYEVYFSTKDNKDVKCEFATDKPTAKIVKCKYQHHNS